MSRKNKRSKFKDYNPQDEQLPKKSFTSHDLVSVKPLTNTQEKVFDAWYNTDKNLFLTGSAGTGKSFLSVYLALNEIFDADSPYDKVIIVSPAQTAKDQGFLPGTYEEKIEIFKDPYVAICNDLFTYKKSFENLCKLGLVEFTTISYLRGLTFSRAIIIVEECQNLTIEQSNTVITRCGDYTRLIVNGDFKQTDLVKKHEVSGYQQLHKIVENMPDWFETVTFGHDDVVRSGLVKHWIMTKEKLGY